ncbi:MAG: TIGR01777 family oxidoreductase [Thermoanaerobaculia bacterium]
MKIVIPGGSGHLGSALTRSLRAAGHRVVILSRNVESPGRLWDGRTLGDWVETIDGAHAVINLAGRSVDCRYDARHRDEILRSRVDSTRVIGEAIASVARPPAVWLQASTATIYSHRYDAPNDERGGIIGGTEPDIPDEWRFSVEVARAWEKALDDAPAPHTRKVKLRTAMVMSAARGGAFHAFLRQVRLGFGRFGDGRQYMSWIHERDFVRAIEWLLAHDLVDGAVNIAAPEPLPNADFMRILAEEWGAARLIPALIPTSTWMVEVGAWLARTEPELVLKSRRVVPKRLLEQGFTFEFPRWNDAARDLCARVRGAGEEHVW